MSVFVASCTLAELFAGNEINASDDSIISGQLHLPDYQRPYRWKARELSRLLNDLKDYFDTPEPGHDFYLGSIILHQEEKEGKKLLNIIDGQQRITTIALLAYLLGLKIPDLEFHAPETHNRIRLNLQWLSDQKLPFIDLSRLNVTLVVTRSSDDAYLFFETQNTGGVRLTGSQIIKPHHLRVFEDVETRNYYARQWESMLELEPLVDAVMKARYWSVIDFRELPSHRNKKDVRNEIVSELAEGATKGGDDAYRQIKILKGNEKNVQAPEGYDMRQPLRVGVNSIHYLRYFYALRVELLQCITEKKESRSAFTEFYSDLICQVDGCDYLKNLYDSCLLLYVSRFGRARFYEAALWLFRVVYERRVKNKKSVKESSVPNFVYENPVFDWILMCYTEQQLFERLQEFSSHITNDNIGGDDKGVKKRFVDAVVKWFDMGVKAGAIAEDYDKELVAGIKRKLIQTGENHG